jgi:hypothetical protein
MREIKFRVWHNFEKCWEECLDNPNHRLCQNNGMPLFRLPLEKCKIRYPHNPDRDIDDYPFATLSHVLGSPDFYSIQQFTGLKDKNGKDIYEGDIISYTPFNQGDYKNTIVKVPLLTSFHWLNELEDMLHMKNQCDIVVIGNAHENPELLAQKS